MLVGAAWLDFMTALHILLYRYTEISTFPQSLTGISTLQHGRSIQTVHVPHSTYPRNTRS